MHPASKHAGLALAAVLVLGALARAESPTGTLSGTVTARDGSRLPGVVLTLTRADRGAVVVTAASGGSGFYRLPGLSAGRYDLSAAAPGFAERTVAVVVEAGATHTLDLALEVAGIRESLTVTGLGARDSLEATTMREGAARDVGEALDGMAGLAKLRKGAIANDVVLRGLQSRDLNVVIDGQRVYGACPNHMDPPSFHVDFAEVERIEVAKGPFDLRHQGSLGGLVNVVTRAPEEGAHVQASFSYGSFGHLNPGATASYGTKRLAGLLGASYRRSDPYGGGSGRLFTETTNYRPEVRASDAYRAATAWARVAYAPADGHRVILAYTRQEADHVLYPYLAMDALTDDTDRASLGYEGTGLSRHLQSLRVQAYLTRVDHRMTDALRSSSAGAPRGYSMGTNASARTAGGRVEAVLGGVTLGLEGYRREWSATTEMSGMGYAPQHSVPEAETASVGAYAETSHSLGEVVLVVGARFDRLRSVADGEKANTDLYFAYNGTRSLARTDHLPSGKVRLSWTPAPGLEIEGGVGHTARVAEGNERFFALKRPGSDWVGNPALDPARHTGLDAGVRFDRGGLHAETSGYYGRVEDFITVREAPRLHGVPGVMNARARSYANVDVVLWGGELQAVLNLQGRFFLSARLAYVRGTQEPRPDLGIASTSLAEVPPLSGRAALRFDDGRFFALAEGVFTAAQDEVDTDLGESPTAGYGLLNLRAGYRRGRLALAMGVDDLLDRSYVEHLSYQRDPFRTGQRVEAPGRSLHLNASVRF
jgi:iron complex outermembrane receptor protein